jgi:rhodanese-related sulfurtransferase
MVMVTELTPAELREKIIRSDPAPVLLDVRETDEYEHCHIEGSVHMPVSQVVQHYEQLDATKELVIICHHGIRSKQIGFLLAQNGFKHIFNLRGGINAWITEIDPSLPGY